MTLRKTNDTTATHGEKMIQINIRLWTNKLSDKPGKIIPKNAWGRGVVSLERNKTHGIPSGKQMTFNSMLDLGVAIEKVLIEGGVVIHPSRRTRKYSPK